MVLRSFFTDIFGLLVDEAVFMGMSLIGLLSPTRLIVSISTVWGFANAHN